MTTEIVHTLTMHILAYRSRCITLRDYIDKNCLVYLDKTLQNFIARTIFNLIVLEELLLLLISYYYTHTVLKKMIK